eukprot:680000-Pyramimonas_sp.AAC.1
MFFAEKRRAQQAVSASLGVQRLGDIDLDLIERKLNSDVPGAVSMELLTMTPLDSLVRCQQVTRVENLLLAEGRAHNFNQTFDAVLAGPCHR